MGYFNKASLLFAFILLQGILLHFSIGVRVYFIFKFLIIFISIRTNFYHKVSAYMEVDIANVEQLNELTYFDFTKVYVRKVNKIRKIFGNATYKIPLDNTFLCEILVYKKQGGEYRLLPYKIS